MKTVARVLSLSFLVFVAACGQYTLVKPGKVKVGDLAVQSSMAWSQLSSGNAYIWTVDGQFLHEIYFVTDLEDNEPLLVGRGEDNQPKFKSGMTSIEIADLFKNSLASKSVRDFEIKNLRPATFAATEGFRFEFDYRTSSGVEKTGMAIGAVRNKKLNLIFYHGTRLHYFDRYKEEVEAIIASAQFT